jgi:hypothetical protein
MMKMAEGVPLREEAVVVGGVLFLREHTWRVSRMNREG